MHACGVCVLKHICGEESDSYLCDSPSLVAAAISILTVKYLLHPKGLLLKR
jgi:hypothetical protein